MEDRRVSRIADSEGKKRQQQQRKKKADDEDRDGREKAGRLKLRQAIGRREAVRRESKRLPREHHEKNKRGRRSERGASVPRSRTPLLRLDAQSRTAADGASAAVARGKEGQEMPRQDCRLAGDVERERENKSTRCSEVRRDRLLATRVAHQTQARVPRLPFSLSLSLS